MNKIHTTNGMLLLNISDVERLSIQLANKIIDKPELVVFVAKGSYLIGKTIADYFQVPLMEVKAVRSGNKLKAFAKPILKLLPNWLKVWLRRKEINMNYHEKNTQRNVEVSDPHNFSKMNFQNILLVDDSIDTGYTILNVKHALLDIFPHANIDVASLFVFDTSKERINTNYFLYENTIFSAPWSNDSKEYKIFINNYYKMKSKGVF